MTAIDTNIIVRLLTNDDPAQARRAAALIESDDIFIAKTVLLETEWVLRSAYSLDRSAIHRSLQALLGLPQVALEDAESVWSALDAYAGGIDFADALHIASAKRTARRFATFDRVLAKTATMPGIVPVIAL